MGRGGRMEQSSNPSNDNHTTSSNGGGDGASAGMTESQRRGLPDFLLTVKLKYVRLGYHYVVQNFLTLLLVPLMAAVLLEVGRIGPEELKFLWEKLEFDLAHAVSCSGLLVFITTVYFLSRQRVVYLVDYSCYRPPDSCRVPFATFMEHSRLFTYFDQKSLDFQKKILERSGLSEEISLPPALHYIPPTPTMAASREEAQMVIFSAMDDPSVRCGAPQLRSSQPMKTDLPSDETRIPNRSPNHNLQTGGSKIEKAKAVQEQLLTQFPTRLPGVRHIPTRLPGVRQFPTRLPGVRQFPAGLKSIQTIQDFDNLF